jgi:hypothetical protein
MMTFITHSIPYFCCATDFWTVKIQGEDPMRPSEKKERLSPLKAGEKRSVVKIPNASNTNYLLSSLIRIFLNQTGALPCFP